MRGNPGLPDKTVLAGVVDGRDVGRTDPDAALGRAAPLLGSARRVEIATSCSLLHVPTALAYRVAATRPAHEGGSVSAGRCVQRM